MSNDFTQLYDSALTILKEVGYSFEANRDLGPYFANKPFTVTGTLDSCRPPIPRRSQRAVQNVAHNIQGYQLLFVRTVH